MLKVYINNNLDSVTADELNHDLAALPLWRREVALAYKFQMGQVQCAKAYLLLMQALREVYGIEDEQTFIIGEHGKPSLANHPEIHFNLSHCKAGVMCVVSDANVGCDIEPFVSKVNPDLCNYCMSDAEVKQIMAAENPNIEFTRLWTMKEAVLKLAGTGVNNRMRDILTKSEGVIVESHTDTEYGCVWSIAH